MNSKNLLSLVKAFEEHQDCNEGEARLDNRLSNANHLFIRQVKAETE